MSDDLEIISPILEDDHSAPRRIEADDKEPNESLNLEPVSSEPITAGAGFTALRLRLKRRLKILGAPVLKKAYIKPVMATTGLVCWSGICALMAWGAWAAEGLPDTSDMWTEKRPASVVFLDRYDNEFLTRGSRATTPVNLAVLPDYVPQALIGVEDRRFYYHPGFDPIGMVNAAIDNYKAGRVVRGGSTLTQQLAKNLFLTSERSLRRKSQEMILALWLEHKFTKDQILELYLGRVYFGSGAWGVDAAAERYFAKPASDLTLGESAMLVGLLKAPSDYNPSVNAPLTSKRTTTVLGSMVRAEFITQEQLSAEIANVIEVEPAKTQTNSSYFVDWVWNELVTRIGEPTQDIIVRTTLDLKAQHAAQSAVDAHLNPARGADQAALVAMDGTGGVRAMIGGANYGASQFNRAVDAHRQPGSAFKPFVYLAAMKSGIRPWSMRFDAPVIIDDWEPSNFSNKYIGRISVAEAFAKSLNTVAIVLSEEVGRERVVDTAAMMGLEGLKPLRSIALGAQETTALELTQAYLPFANWGYRQTAYGIDAINGVDGRQLYARLGSGSPVRVLDGDILRDMNMLMHKTVEEGTGKNARIDGRELAGKTGTTNDYRDAWFVGYSSDYVAGVWVGNDDYKPMSRITGGSIPARIWRDFMKQTLKDAPKASLPKTVMPIRVSDNQRTEQHFVQN